MGSSIRRALLYIASMKHPVTIWLEGCLISLLPVIAVMIASVTTNILA